MTESITLPTTGYVRQTQLLGDRKNGIAGVIPFSPATLWRKVSSGDFPAPVKLSAGITAWKVEDVRAWMEDRTNWPPASVSPSPEKGTPMPDDEFIQKLAAALAAQLQPPIPVSIDLWDVATIARVLKRSETQVRNRMICLPDFPKAIRLPMAGGGRGQPLYRAYEVLTWIGKYQDKN
jgi:predicted DNA-binding transcriptional regulator AlpA